MRNPIPAAFLLEDPHISRAGARAGAASVRQTPSTWEQDDLAEVEARPAKRGRGGRSGRGGRGKPNGGPEVHTTDLGGQGVQETKDSLEGHSGGKRGSNTKGLEDLGALGVSQEDLEAQAEAEDNIYSGLPAGRNV